MATGPYIGAALALIAAGVYLYVARTVSARPVRIDDRFAHTMFSLWWWTLGASTIVTASLTLLGLAGIRSFVFFIAVTYLNLALVLVGLWGMLYYQAHRFLQRPIPVLPLILLYVGVFVFFVYFIQLREPDGVEVQRWSVVLHYAKPPVTGGLLLAAIVLLLGPQMLGAAAFLVLAGRMEDRAERLRLRLVGGAILLWFGSASAGAVAGLSQTDWWQIFTRLVALAAALIVLSAYKPPAWMRQRYGLNGPSGAAS